MNTAIIGYGKMGREVEKLLLSRGHKVALIVDQGNTADLTAENLRLLGVDVAIEFTDPESAYGNVMTCLRAGVAVVCGTTGWLDQLDSAVEYCKSNSGSLFYASNYSLGVNIMFKLNKELADMMNAFGQYDVTVEEVHHTGKKDAPSGTAITIAQDIVEKLDRKSEWVGATTTVPDQLEVLAVRRSVAPGTHTVTYESAVDAITLTHTAKSRGGLAVGAVMAAEFICGREGYFTMNDLLGF